MQVLLNIPEAYFEDECSPAFAYKVRAKIEKEYNLRPMDDVEVVNIGPGADWIVILATISIAWKVFQVPGQIKKSLEGCDWLIKKLKGYIKKDQLVSLDQDAAGMLAIDYLSAKYGEDESFDLLDSYTIPIVDITGMVRNSIGGLANQPHCYHIFTFRIADRIIILSVRSTGKIRELEAFHDMPYGLSDYDAE